VTSSLRWRGNGGQYTWYFWSSSSSWSCMYYSTDVRVFGDCTCTSNFRSHQAARSCNAAEEARQHFSESSKTARTERRFEQNSYSRATCELIGYHLGHVLCSQHQDHSLSLPNPEDRESKHTTASRRIPVFQRLVQVGTRSNRWPPAAPHRVRSAINSRRHSSHQPY